MIDLEEIIIQSIGPFESRDIGLVFSCAWDGENGIGIQLVNEKVMEVGYRNITA